MKRSRALKSAAGGLALLLSCWALPVLAQSQIDPAPAKGLTLSAEQKLLIYQSVSAMHKNNAAPPGFRPAVGTVLPSGIELQPMPGAVVSLIPTLKSDDVAMIEKQVVVVDPESRTVLAVVTATQ